MPSPFPGMDPYLEQHWGDVHSSLVIYARNQLQKVLPKDLRARVEERVVVTGLGRPRSFFPDVRVIETERTARRPLSGAADVAVVRRGWRPLQVDYYPISMAERLPTIKVPLRPSDRDVPLDLQAMIERCYEDGGYDDIDYAEELRPPLPPATARWAARLLRRT